MIDTARKVLRLLDADKRHRWIALVVLSFLASVFEALGAVLILVVLSLVQDPRNAVELPLIGDLRQRFSGTPPSTLFTWVCIVTGLFFLARAVVQYFHVYAQQRLAHNAGVRLAAQLLEGYLEEPYERHTMRNSSVLIRNISESIHSLVAWTLIPLIVIMSEALMVAGVIVVLAVTAPVVTLTGGAFLGIQTVILLKVLRPRLVRLGATSQDMAAASLESLQQALHGFREVRLFGRTSTFVGEFNERRSLFARVQYQQAGLVTAPRLIVETLFVLGLLVFLLLATDGRGTNAETLSLLGLLAYAVLRIMPSLNRIVVNIGNLRFGGAAVDELTAEVERVRADVGMRVPVDDLPERPLERQLECRHVGYRYPSSDGDVLAAVDLTIHRGQYVGLVGATGSGKSTLVDLLVGLLSPTAGVILVDGIDVASNIPGWQRSLGVVSQTVFLVDETLRRNVAFGIPEATIDDALVADAISMAQLDELIASLPLGLETMVGERGVRLSGGQRQRVAIARALYHQPTVLFFDEGTSALDTLTESEVMAALEGLRGDRTIVAVAHRLSTVKRCDQIFVLDAGRVVDRGTFVELEQRSDAFRRMAL